MNFIKPCLFSFFVFAMGLLFHSCTKNIQNISSDNLENYKEYVNGFTSGSLPRNESVKIFFNKVVGDTARINQMDDFSFMSFEPKMPGKYKWSSAYALEFFPEKDKIIKNQIYQCKLDLKGLFTEVPDSIRYLVFSFQIEPIIGNIEWSFLRPDLSDRNKMYLNGKLVLNDELSESQLSEWIQISQETGMASKASYEKDPNQPNLYQIQINNILRKDLNSTLSIKWKKRPDESGYSMTKEIEIPSASTFCVTGVETSNDKQKLISLYFSDPLDANQDLRGLVHLTPDSSALRIQKLTDLIQVFISEQSNFSSGTIGLHPFIKNSFGNSLQSQFSYSYNFHQISPAIRFADGGQGSILPYSNELILPIEAINLKAFDVEIFKLFSNNVLFNMHMNSYNDDYTLVKLGRIIHQQHIEMEELITNGNKKDWIAYGLDLKKMIEPDPGSIYEIRLTFKPEYTDYYCPGAKPILPESRHNGYSGDPKIISNWVEWWPYNYDSEEENQDDTDPCNYTYYKANNFARRSVLASNIAMTAKASDEGEQAFASVFSILDGRPVSGAEVTFYDAQLQELIRIKTDGNGIVMPALERKPLFIMAKDRNQYSYLKLAEGKSLSISEFDVSGTSSSDGMKASIYTERGIWRPGDTILFNVILNQQNKVIPEQFPLELILKNPLGQIVQKLHSSGYKYGLYSFKIPTKPTDPTGLYRAIVKAGPSIFEKNLRIETVKPNRFKVAWNIDPLMDFFSDGARAELQASWLFGSPASNTNAKVELKYNLVPPIFKTHTAYTFLDPERKQISGILDLFDGKLDDQGKKNIALKGIDKNTINGKLNCLFISRITDNGGDISTDYFNQEVNIFNEYVGIKIPDSDYGKKLDIGKDQFIQIVVLDKLGKPVPNREVQLDLYNVKWEWWYEVSHGSSDFANSNFKKFVQSKKVVTDHQGKASVSYKLDSYDRFYIRATHLQNKYVTGDYFFTGWPYDENGEGKEFANMLMFKSDKEKYTIGERAKVILPGAEKGTYMISIIRENKILKQVHQSAQKGKTIFEFEVNEQMSPNVYLDVVLIQALKGIKNDLPVRMYGVIPIFVEDNGKRLNPVIIAKESILPDEDFSIEVSEKSGREMSYQLFVVDEGLLNLTRFKTPNPYDDFFAKEALKMMSWDNYNDIIGSENNKLMKIFSIGGDESISAADLEKMERFKSVVLASGPGFLKKGEKKIIKFKIENYIGSVRAMLIANTNDSYGSTEKAISVKKDLMTQLTLPRVLASSDVISIPVTVFVTDPKISVVNISINAQGNISLIGSTTKTVSFSKVGEQTVFFQGKANGKIGPASVKVTVSSGQLSSAHEIKSYVDNPNPITHQVKEFWVEPGQTLKEVISSYGQEGTQSVLLEVSGLAGFSLNKYLDRLIQYPHGCIEQTTSSVFPQIYLDQLTTLNPDQKSKINENIQNAIHKFRGFQQSNGGFSYWPGNPNVYDWASSYVGHFLIEAKNNAIRVPEDMMSSWYNYQKQKATGFTPSKNTQLREDEVQAYRLYTLALYGKPEWGAMNKLNVITDKSLTSAWLLAGAYALAGKKDIASNMILNLSEEVNSYRDDYYTYGSNIRDESIIAMVLFDLNKKGDANRVLSKLNKKVKNMDFLSTQEMSFLLITIGKLFSNKENSSMGHFEFSWNDKKEEVKNEYALFSKKLIPSLKNQSFEFQNKSSSPLNISIVQSGKSILENSTSDSRVLKMDIEYLSNGRKVDLKNIKYGSDVIARISVKNEGTHGNLKNVSLTAVFPGGFEIRNNRIGGIQNNGIGLDYQNYRDDRVLSYFSLPIGKTQIIDIALTAAYSGEYLAPEMFAEAMYDPSAYARLSSGLMIIKR